MAGCGCGGACKKKAVQEMGDESSVDDVFRVAAEELAMDEYRKLKAVALGVRLNPLMSWTFDYAI